MSEPKKPTPNTPVFPIKFVIGSRDRKPVKTVISVGKGCGGCLGKSKGGGSK